jgi:hypothetical protein
MLHIFHTYVATIYSKYFNRCYVAISVFMLQVTSVLSGCCICFTYMLQVYVLYVSSVLYVRCIQVFHVVRGFRRAQGVERAPVPGDRERRAGDRWMGHAPCRCPTDRARCGGRRSGHNGGRVHVWEGMTSNRRGQGVLCVRGESSRRAGGVMGRGAHVGREKKISGWGRLRASPGASTAVTETGDSACIYLLSKMVSLASIC